MPGGGKCLTRYFASVIDIVGPTLGTAQGTEVNHLPVPPQKGVLGAGAFDFAVADNPLAVVDRRSPAHTASKSSKIYNLTFRPKDGMWWPSADPGGTDSISGLVYRLRRFGARFPRDGP